jgi:hypothetical protein
MKRRWNEEKKVKEIKKFYYISNIRMCSYHFFTGCMKLQIILKVETTESGKKNFHFSTHRNNFSCTAFIYSTKQRTILHKLLTRQCFTEQRTKHCKWERSMRHIHLTIFFYQSFMGWRRKYSNLILTF